MTAPANPFAYDAPAQPDAAAPTTTTPAPVPAQQAAPPAAPAAPAAPGGADPFDGPAPQATRPRVLDMYNRLVLVIPHKVETVPNRLQPGTTQDRMTADVIVLDGGPLQYGGAPEKVPPVPHDKQVNVPHKIDRMFLSQAGLISQSSQALAKRQRGEPGMVLGRLTTGEASKPGHNPPWLLSPPTDADKQAARAYLATVDPFA